MEPIGLIPDAPSKKTVNIMIYLSPPTNQTEKQATKLQLPLDITTLLDLMRV
jgi:hypothetical protein